MPFFSRRKPKDLHQKPSTAANDSQRQHTVQTNPSSTHLSNGNRQKLPVRSIQAPPPVYRPLNASKHEIRLLRLHPGQDHDPLVCTFEYTSLASKQNIPYETVSYCWGRDPGEAVIEIDRRPAKVTWSAVRVLHRLRHREKSRMLWVDAICINQGSNSERSQQVAIMSMIYSQTWRNLVWLGGDDTSAGAVETALTNVVAHMNKKTSDCRKLFNMTHEKTGARDLLKDGTLFRKMAQGHLDALLPLFSRPWFGRLWVAQEVALAPANLCHFGSVTFDLNDVLRAAVWLRYNTTCIPSALIESPGFNKAIKLWYLVDRKCVPSKVSDLSNRTLCSTWQLLKWMETTNPKDNVYALLGMVRKANSRPSRLVLVPDYAKSDGEVFQDATRVMIEETRGLTILQNRCETDAGCAQDGELAQDVPTWAIRFDVKTYRDAGPRPFAGSFNAHDGHFIDCSTRSSKGGPNILSVRGVAVDQVVRRTSCTPSLFKNNTSPLIHEALRVAHPHGQKPNSWSWEFSEKFAMTLMAGRNWIGQPAGPQDMDDFVAFMKYMAKHGQNPPAASYGEMGRYDEESQRIIRCFHTIAIACSKRRFFVTVEGRFGLGPGGLRDGDLIVVLSGGALPFALRRVAKTRYRWVGACYVLGIMEGEAMRKHKAGGSADNVFHIV